MDGHASGPCSTCSNTQVKTLSSSGRGATNPRSPGASVRRTRPSGDPSSAGGGRDAAADVPALKDRFDEIHVIGSGSLVRSLLEADQLDRLNLFLYPVTFGSGKRLFADGTGVPAAFRLAQPARSFPKGATWLVYERAGQPVTGIDISQDE